MNQGQKDEMKQRRKKREYDEVWRRDKMSDDRECKFLFMKDCMPFRVFSGGLKFLVINRIMLFMR